MLLQTNSYIVPKDKRAAHGHLMQRFRQVLMKIGCDHFEVFEQVGANWTGGDSSGRFVQLMKFRDRKHCQAVQQVERQDAAAQAIVREFCDLINFPYQEQQGLFAHGFYNAVIEPIRTRPGELAFHHYEDDASAADAAKRIAAGLPDTPHSIDGPPIDAAEAAAGADEAAAVPAVENEQSRHQSQAVFGEPEEGDDLGDNQGESDLESLDADFAEADVLQADLEPLDPEASDPGSGARADAGPPNSANAAKED